MTGKVGIKCFCQIPAGSSNALIENNARPLYSWVMNNNWETNFKMDLSGFCQYDYSLWLTDISDPEQAMDELHEQLFDPYVLIVR